MEVKAIVKYGETVEFLRVKADTIEEAKTILLKGEKPDVDEGDYFRVGGVRVWLTTTPV